ncbi:MAG: hypothetical protein IJ215_04685 [Clostridia bacterium]|nr:hypothetical protein [Clostridia bacterium]
MKNKSGVSIITLVVTIMIIIILASIAIFSGRESIDETSRTKIDVEIGNIKDAVARRMIDNARNSLTYPFIGDKVSDITVYIPYIVYLSDEQKDALRAKVIASSPDNYRLLDSATAVSLGVDGINERNYYIIDYSTGDVYGAIDMESYLKDNPS